MTHATTAARSAAAIVRRDGEPVTYTAGALITACYCVLTRSAEPILSGGQIVIDEDHYRGQIPVAALTTTPAVGNTLTTAAAVVYRVDVPPELRDEMWILTLRRTD
jgi:hypothetical protein